MTETKQKLANLREYLPDADPNLCEFAAYLATRLNSELVPTGFAMACQLVLYDLQSGVDGFTGKRIGGNLVGFPSIFYVLLERDIPRLADAVLPADFAAELKSFTEEVHAAARKPTPTTEAKTGVYAREQTIRVRAEGIDPDDFEYIIKSVLDEL